MTSSSLRKLLRLSANHVLARLRGDELLVVDLLEVRQVSLRLVEASAIVAGEAGEIWRNTNRVVGIEEVPAATLLGVHPVPYSGVVILEVPNDVRAMSGTVQVIDLHGREVLSAPVGSGRNWTFDIGSLVPGCYAGRVVLADGRVYRVRLQRD